MTEMVPGGIGASVIRPDARGKTLGALPYAGDLFVEGMLHAAIARCPHPHAVIRSIDVTAARALPGVRDVVVAADIPGTSLYGPERSDRPVLADDLVRHLGEGVAAVAADDAATARRAAAAIAVEYDVLPPQPDLSAASTAAPLHPDGNVVREVRVLHGGDALAEAIAGAAVLVEATYSIAARGPEGSGPSAALALPVGGGLVLHTASGWPQSDRDQVAQCLNLTPPQLRLIPTGAAGPPDGGLDVAVLACLLAGRTGRPVRLVDHRAGVARAPGAGPAALLHYRHHADADGRLVAVQARLLLDAGAYAGVARTTLAALCTAAVGPYRVPHAELTGHALRTTNPQAPALRGGGAAAACIAYEAQLDALAARLGLHPLEVRARNALDETDELPTGQLVPGGVGVLELLAACAEAPLPGRRRAYSLLELPGGAGAPAERSALRRGVGFAAGLTPLLPGEAADPPATATVRYRDGRASVACAAPELGQGFLSVAAQIVREILGTADCELVPTDADSPSAGPAAGSRLTWVAGGAVAAAARGVADQICAGLAATRGLSANLLTARGGRVRSFDGLLDASLAELAAGRAFEATATFAPPATEPLDSAGQGNAYAGFALAAHRAVVEVDPDLGLVRVVDLTTAVDVGRIVNLVQLVGALEGGTAAGVGLALLEDLSSPWGALVPDALDVPPVTISAILENPQSGAPFGARGIWDATVGPAAAAVLAAVRDATGAPVRSVPVRPWDLTSGRTEGSA